MNNFTLQQDPGTNVEAAQSSSNYKKQTDQGEAEPKLTAGEGALSLISTQIGAGLLCMPYAFLQLGVPGATVACVVGAWATLVSCRLFLEARDTIPANIQSYFELGFALYGRASIYYISAIIGLYAWGLMVIYFIVFADITKSLVAQLILSDKPGFFTSRSCYSIILALALFPQVIKKELAELKVASIILFGGVGIFLAVLGAELLLLGYEENPDKSFYDYVDVNQGFSAVKALSFVLVAYGMQAQVFPLLNSLKDQQSSTALTSVAWSLYASFVMYLMCGLLGLFFYGSALHDNILDNIGEEENLQSCILRIVFVLVLGCHIPFIFFQSKEAVLIIVDEYNRKSISKELQDRLPSGSTELAELLEAPNDGSAPTETNVKTSPAYKQMPYSIYLTFTLLTYLSQLVGALLIEDIGIIFQYLSGICCCNMSFFLPAIAYLTASNRYHSDAQRAENAGSRRLSYLFLVLGLVTFALLMSIAVMSTIESVNGGKKTVS